MNTTTYTEDDAARKRRARKVKSNRPPNNPKPSAASKNHASGGEQHSTPAPNTTDIANTQPGDPLKPSARKGGDKTEKYEPPSKKQKLSPTSKTGNAAPIDISSTGKPEGKSVAEPEAPSNKHTTSSTDVVSPKSATSTTSPAANTNIVDDNATSEATTTIKGNPMSMTATEKPTGITKKNATATATKKTAQSITNAANAKARPNAKLTTKPKPKPKAKITSKATLAAKPKAKSTVPAPRTTATSTTNGRVPIEFYAEERDVIRGKGSDPDVLDITSQVREWQGRFIEQGWEAHFQGDYDKAIAKFHVKNKKFKGEWERKAELKQVMDDMNSDIDMSNFEAVTYKVGYVDKGKWTYMSPEEFKRKKKGQKKLLETYLKKLEEEKAELDARPDFWLMRVKDGRRSACTPSVVRIRSSSTSGMASPLSTSITTAKAR